MNIRQSLSIVKLIYFQWIVSVSHLSPCHPLILSFVLILHKFFNMHQARRAVFSTISDFAYPNITFQINSLCGTMNWTWKHYIKKISFQETARTTPFLTSPYGSIAVKLLICKEMEISLNYLLPYHQQQVFKTFSKFSFVLQVDNCRRRKCNSSYVLRVHMQN